MAKLLHMCQERADIMYSVKETARKIICSTESDEMHMRRITRYLEECLIEILTFPQSVNVYTDSDWASHAIDLQEHKRWSCAETQPCLQSHEQQSVSLSHAEAELSLTTGTCRREW